MPRLRRSLLSGALLGTVCGAWAAAWICGFLLVWGSGRLTLGVDVPARFESFVAVEPNRVLRFMLADLGIGRPMTFRLLSLLLIAVPSGVGAVVGAVSAATGMDPRGVGRGSFLWALRSMLDVRVLTASVAPLVMITTAVAFDLLVGIPGMVVLLLGAELVVPISVCRAEVGAGRWPAGWWLPRWPGLRPLLLVVLLEGLLVGALWFDRLPVGGPAGVVLVIVLVGGLTLLLRLLEAIALVEAPAVFVAKLRRAFTWRCFGPWLSYNLHLVVAALLALVPVFVVYVFLWKVVPVVSSIAEVQGETLAPVWSFGIAVVLFVGRFSGFVLPVLIAILFWLGACRLVVALDRTAGVAGSHPGERRDAGREDPKGCAGTLEHERADAERNDGGAG